ncbi:hypothetical protein Shyhy02_13120 [Streptomyces hygroscopicus subsp. hygroscopicus]|nr:hypothetical protein Shyhy02_13120 [Streptomyces hygroscopicus subsp. hygroscopicus]
MAKAAGIDLGTTNSVIPRTPARKVIAHEGYDPVYGARPLRRFISHEVETLIGRALLKGDVQEGATVKVDAQHGELVVTYEQPSGEHAEERARQEVGEAA